jgi:oxygen-independent coproporphyrinogen-3 oxidase
VRGTFDLDPRAEITVECAPGTLTAATVAALRECGVNRVSLGVQSMFDREAAAVGRRHTRAVVLEDIARLRAAGIANINIDLIAGLPHQTAASWRESIDAVLVTGVPHVSVYMLEVDGDSRLGRELIAGGARYHAHFVPNEDATADFYVQACAQLEQTGVRQYEISNFARSGFESIHNLKYWTRRPYLGFGLDAHSMLPVAASHQPVSVSAAGGLVLESVRFSTPDSLDAFLAAGPLKRTAINRNSAREEAFFLGLRLNRGVDLKEIACEFGSDMNLQDAVAGLVAENLLDRQGGVIRLTDKGRLLSNEVFERFLAPVPTIAE